MRLAATTLPDRVRRQKELIVEAQASRRNRYPLQTSPTPITSLCHAGGTNEDGQEPEMKRQCQ
jgi:hypothetical protein